MMIRLLKDIYRREAYFPGILGLFINPFYFARKGLAFHIKTLGALIKGKVLDIGCGTKPYEAVYSVNQYIGLEYDTPENRKKKKADYFYDGKKFPFGDETFDSAVANQVFEHVFNPEEFLVEINRILKTKGILLLTVPFVWDEHEQPRDFARYTSFGLNALLEKSGFEIVEHRKSIDDVRVIFQLINAYIYKIVMGKQKVIDVLLTVLLIAPFNIIGSILGKVLPRNSDLYLDNIFVAKKVKNYNGTKRI